ncbi:MAG: hypothetical protein ABL899_01255 [Nitrospira sp.]
MSKKNIIISSVVLSVILVLLVGYYFASPKGDGTTGGATGFRSFFPFGGNDTPVNTTPIENGTSTEETTPTATDFTQKLRRLSLNPVSGAGTLDTKAGTVVRHIEKATGHIYETEMFSPNQNRISNTTIPKPYDALWLNKNGSLIARYLKEDNQTVDTYSLSLKTVSTTTENTISGIAFPNNISDVSVVDSSVFYLQQNTTSSLGFVSNFDGTKKKQIWNSPIKELSSQYVNSKTVALTTKPAQNINGFMYFVDTGNGQVKKVLGGIFGLSTLVNADATKVLYLEQGSNAVTFLYDIKSKTSTAFTPTAIPEKCVWSKKEKDIIYCAIPRENISGNSLTSWYQGFTSFTDDIWKYDTKNNISGIIENLSEDSGVSIDAIKPILSDNEQYLIFINKTDNSLWSLDLLK